MGNDGSSKLKLPPDDGHHLIFGIARVGSTKSLQQKHTMIIHESASRENRIAWTILRNRAFLAMSLLFFLISIGKPASADQTLTTFDSAYGFWKLENSPETLRVAVKYNNGFAKIFLVGGDWSTASNQPQRFPYRGKAAELTERFRINNSHIKIPFIGQREVLSKSSGGSQIKLVEEIYHIPAEIEGDKLTLRLNNGINLVFRKTNLSETLFEYAGLVVSSFAAIALLFFILIAYARVGIGRIGKMVSAKRDRRYKEWGRLRGGGSYQSIAASALLGFGIIFVVHNTMLGLLGVSGVLSHINFWLF